MLLSMKFLKKDLEVLGIKKVFQLWLLACIFDKQAIPSQLFLSLTMLCYSLFHTSCLLAISSALIPGMHWELPFLAAAAAACFSVSMVLIKAIVLSAVARMAFPPGLMHSWAVCHLCSLVNRPNRNFSFSVSSKEQCMINVVQSVITA
jgi:hypothetical protein